MEYSIEYLAPNREFTIGSGTGSDVFIEADKLEGLVGQFEDEGVAAVGVPGESFDFRDRVILPMEASFTLVVRNADAWREVRRGFSATRPGTLIIRGEVTSLLPVVLRESLPSPTVKPGVGSRIEVSLVARGGVWLRPQVSPGPTVHVGNPGDTPVWPRFVWDGAGGEVTMPSGAAFTLPQVDGVRTLRTDRRYAGQVFTADGEYDREVTRITGAVCEQVPVGDSRTFTVPQGCRVEWDVEVLDPWS